MGRSSSVCRLINGLAISPAWQNANCRNDLLAASLPGAGMKSTSLGWGKRFWRH
jgi:hypothetical protein